MKVEATDLLAQCLSHEIDHLTGYFIDKVIRYVDLNDEQEQDSDMRIILWEPRILRSPA